MHLCYQMIGPFRFNEKQFVVLEIIIFLEMLNLLKRNT